MVEMAVTGRKRSRRAPREMAAEIVPVVKPGMVGGCYQPLSHTQVEQIHQSVLEVLETIGMGDAPPTCIELVTAAGGELTDDGRLLFPRALVEDIISRASREVILYGQDKKHDVSLSGSKVHFGTAGQAVHIVDCDNLEYRDPTLKDLFDMARLVDRLDNLHIYQRPIVPRDVLDTRELDINTCYASVAGTSKHVGTNFFSPETLNETVKMLDIIAGGENEFRKRPFVSLTCCFSVPPLKFGKDACEVMEAAVHAGMPVLLLSAGQAGATCPASLAGTVVQEIAETLAGLVYINLMVSGHPTILGPWPFVSDLRTGAMSGGSGEQAVVAAACAQMTNFYDLPGGVAAGMTDSKLPDIQAGYEKGYTNVLAGQAGANMVYEAAGMHASLLGCCYESFVIDNDMLGAVQRSIRGIEVTSEDLSIEVMRQVCTEGPGHYLGHGQTMNLMRSAYLYPEIGDRLSPDEWLLQDCPSVLDRAKNKVKEVLEGPLPSHISPEVDALIRRDFPILL